MPKNFEVFKNQKSTYNLILQTVEDEYEQSLQWVQYSEGVGHADGLLVQVEEAKRPSQAKEEGQHERTVQPDSEIVE